MELRYITLEQIRIEMADLDEIAELMTDDEYISRSNTLLMIYNFINENSYNINHIHNNINLLNQILYENDTRNINIINYILNN